ncbi:MAG TPA: 3-methyl-2-oxobutanoate hydroxymethyltransferase [Verrucomicrobiae bacterium]|nr:3-methyl-2-oxobutanoate hydroxymethyltransferase [Verrucomicrobiae bacterium]
MQSGKVTPAAIRAMKARGERIASLTAYDYPTTKLLDECGVPLILVGDSLGMVVFGYPDTTHVTMAEMEHHVRAAARARPRALLAADLPYRSYDTPEHAVANARRLVAAGAEAVKAEGVLMDSVSAIVAAGIPFIGHIGMLPQSILEEGRYHIKGKNSSEGSGLMQQAIQLEKAGAFAIVLELVHAPVAKAISEKLSIPTVGIGSGKDCDGQILVVNDLIGTFPWFTPKFVQPKMNAAAQIKAAVTEWKAQL